MLSTSGKCKSYVRVVFCLVKEDNCSQWTIRKHVLLSSEGVKLVGVVLVNQRSVFIVKPLLPPRRFFQIKECLLM